MILYGVQILQTPLFSTLMKETNLLKINCTTLLRTKTCPTSTCRDKISTTPLPNQKVSGEGGAAECLLPVGGTCEHCNPQQQQPPVSAPMQKDSAAKFEITEGVFSESGKANWYKKYKNKLSLDAEGSGGKRKGGEIDDDGEGGMGGGKKRVKGSV